MTELRASSLQRGLFYAHSMHPDSSQFNTSAALHIHRKVDPGALRSAWRTLLERHAALRTAYHQREEGVFRRIASVDDAPQLLERLCRGATDEELFELVVAEHERPLDLRYGSVRLVLFSRAPDDHVLLATAHHLSHDATSSDIVLHELARAYESAVRGASAELAPCGGTYDDYIDWEAGVLGSERARALEAFWQETLRDPPILELPIDHPRPRVRAGRGASHVSRLDSAAIDALRNVSPKTSLYRTLLSVYYVFLWRQTGQRDLVVGTPADMRGRQPEFAHVVGDFTNVMALRGVVDPAQSFRSLLNDVDARVRAASAHRDLPFPRVLEVTPHPRDASRTPIYQTGLNLLRGDLIGHVVRGAPSHMDLGMLSGDVFWLPQQNGLEDLTVVCAVTSTESFVDFKYDVALFEESTIERMASQFRTVLEACAAAPDEPIATLPMGPSKRQAARPEDAEASQPAVCAHTLVAQWARKTPDAIAVVDGDHRLTYAQLRARASAVARQLRALGVRPGDSVALSASRRHETFVGLVGILMAGAAYVPIDSGLPEARRARMIARGGVTLGAGYGELAGLVRSEVRLDRLDDLPPSEDETGGDAGDPMVVLYTSGTTGEPKGVRLPHRGLTSYARTMGNTWKVTPADRVLQFAALSFDASLEEILLAWTAGASLLLRTEEMLEPGKLFAACEANHVTILDIPTAYLPVAVEAAEQRGWPPALRLVIIGGDRADRTCVERFRRTRKPPRLTSTYGPTEASISVTSCDIAEELDDWPSARSPLGATVDGCRIHVLDKTFAPVPVGVRGEIFIAGRCLALGYVSDPALTAERFVPDPFVAGERMYRTGDVGVVRPDGRFEFVGRVDDQIKIRGFRIEPAEVATALSRHPTVADALVLVHKTERGEPMLIAYVRPRGEDYDAQALRVFASEHLPAYMVPSALVTIERWPLNAHGKVDHRALPVPEPSRARAEYVAPRSPVEEKLAAIWSEVLGIPEIGVNDDFFALGGHSLSATLVASRVRAAFRVDLPMRCVFEHPTLAALAEDVAALERGGSNEAAPIPRVSRDGRLPLSFAERRLWFIDQFDPGAPAYHISVSLRLRGPLDHAAMSSALATLVERHEALRTRFVERQGEPVRVIDPAARPSPLKADRVDESRLQEWLAKETLRPFDLARGPLFRTSLAALAPSDHVLVLSMHHIISDGWSVEVMMRELSELYAAAVDKRPAALSVSPIQYADYAAWQEEWLSGERLDKAVAYWRGQLASLPALELPTDRPRPPTISTAGATHTTKMDAAAVTRLRELGRRKGCSLFMVLLAAFEALLSRYSGQKDFAVGTPEARRDRLETEGVIGFFVNTLVVRAKLGDDPTVLEHLGRVREAMLSAHAHADAPFERLVEELNPVRDPSRSPLFQAMFTFVDTAGRLSKLGNLAIEPARPEQTVAAFELALECTEVAGSVVCAFEYSTALFDPSTIERMAAHFQTLVKAMADAPEARVGALPLVGDSERTLLLEQSSARTSATDAECAQSIVRRWARENPKAEAVVDGDRRLTYEQLVARASGVAARLRAAGVERGHFVALSAARRLETIVGMLGVWMCSAAYVPIDPALPEKRRRQMITRCAATVGAGYGDLRGLVQNELRLDEESDAAGSDAAAPCDPRDALVVLYTSGTTGEPKGAVLTHQGGVGYARAVGRAWSVTRDDRILQFASLSFDASLEEILVAWTSGAALVLRDEAMLDPAKLLDACETHGITILDVTTAFLPVVVEAAEVRGWPSRLRRVVIGGERPERAAVERLVEFERRPRLASTYGPTEASISVTECELDEELERWSSGRSPLGNVVEGCRVYVLDAQLALVPVGMPGEICIGGAALARGYAGDPARTAERFVPNPFVPGERIYRTGDVGVRRADGRLEFVGRADDQVKIRGFRIEPSEVAAVLSKHPKVTESVVLAQKTDRGDALLVGYVRCEREASDDELRAFVGEQLPAYMVPAAIVVVERWPLTPNGKIDHRALPRVELDGLRRDYVAPRTPTEERLAAIWAEVLGVERVGVHDEFFALGGHSLLAAKLVSRVRRDLNVELGVRAVFEHPTLAGLATVVTSLAAGARETPIAIPRAPRDAPLPLSFAEGRLWFIDQYEPGTATYNLPVGLRLQGRLDRAALSRALDALVARHESLRTRYPSDSGQPLRVVDEARPVRIAEAEIDAGALEDWSAAHATEPFDLSSGPLFRAALARVGEDDHKLMLVMHHIVSDGWSTDVMMRELEELYSAAKEGRAAKLPELPIQYADYAVWQRAWLSGARLEKSVGYWKQRLAGVSSLELPADRPRPPALSTNGADVTFRIEPELVEKLRALGRRASCSLFMVLLGAYEILLSRYSGQTDFAVGTPEARRNRLETENLIGFFVNTLVVRAELQHDPTVTQILEQVREQMLSAHAHADVPFEAIVEALNPVRDPSRTPLFQAMFSFAGDASEAGKSFGDLAIGPSPAKFGAAKFDLTLTCAELEGGALGCAFTYATALFDAATIERMARHFRAVLEQVGARGDARVSNLQLIDASERRHILVDLNATETERSFEPVVRAFEAWAEKTPDARAVQDHRGAHTYLQLERRANALARRLRALGVGADVGVAVCLPRSAEMVVAQLAVLKAGGCYVSLDTSSPAERLAVIAKEAKIACAITTNELASAVEWGAPVSTGPFDEQDESRVDSHVRPDNLAYIIFTSGSTGTPKGVQLRHDSLSNLVGWYRTAYEPSAADRFGQVAAPSFDVSIAEVWPSVSSGGCLCIPSDDVRRDPAALVRWVRDERITLAFMPTPLGEACLLEDWTGSSVRVLMLAGDALHAVAGGHAFQIDNLYGPTEYTVYTTCFRLPGGAAKSPPPIGSPLDNTRVHVLDSAMSPVPIGVSGELYIGGAGLARGYTRPDLTAERFVPDPFGPPGARLYRTGDLARRRADGVLEFIGRIDHQVKIRGYRIELGEIESTLRAHPGVREAVVVARGEADKRLVAYVVAGEACGDGELRSHLRATLPDYMVPAAFVRLEALPLTPNGKIDRRALPAPDFSTGQAPYVAPRTQAEEALAAIWSEVLGVERVGVDDDFFALGGHSLRAVKLAASVREKLGVHLPVRALFEAPTVARLAAVIASGPGAASSGPLVSLRHGEGPRVAFAHALSGEVFAYGPLAHRLGDRDVLGLRAREIDPLPGDLGALAALYAEALRERDVKYLCGWSMGGLVAFETARLLQKHGRAPAAVVLLDTYLLTDRDGANAGDALGYARDVSFELGADASAELRREIERASSVAEAERAEMLALALERELRIDRRELEERMRVHATLLRAAASYEPAELDVPIHLVAPQPERPLRTWKGKLTPASVTQVRGDHYSMLRAPHVDAVAAALRAIIRG